MVLPAGVYRADHVGSFLRPKTLLAAREKWSHGSLPAEELRKLEDQYISELVPREIAAGVRSITDGEFRRAFFHLDFLKHLDGIEVEGLMAAAPNSSEAQKDASFAPPKLVVTGKIGHSKPVQVDDYNFLVKQTQGQPVTVKVCIPSPTMVHFRGGRDSINSEAYPDLDQFFADLEVAYQLELEDLYNAGARFVQLDDTNLAYLCDQDMRKAAEERWGDTSALTEKYADLINGAISKRPKDLKIGIHLCRGNHRSRWYASGGYEPVAEVLFQKLNVDVYFLEYDDARSGDFSPLRFLPEHKIVVLGLMGSKGPQLDDKDYIKKRLHEAAKFCPKGLDQLCLSHQCGFSSTQEGNDLNEEEQWAKVRLEVEIAKEIWGDDLSK